MFITKDVICDVCREKMSIVGHSFKLETLSCESVYVYDGIMKDMLVQYKELMDLSNKLEELYKLKADDGYTIVVPSSYNNLKKQVEKKVYALSNAMASNGSRDPQDIEQIRLKKCQLTNECERCYEGACVCYYTDNTTKIREELNCWGKTNK